MLKKKELVWKTLSLSNNHSAMSSLSALPSSQVSPSCRWQVGGFVIPLYPSKTMPWLFMMQFAMQTDRSFVLISCCFALGSFSLMIFRFFIWHLICKKTKGGRGGAVQQTDRGPFAFWGRWLVIYKIKSIKDLSRGIINGIRCLTREHKGSLTRIGEWSAIKRLRWQRRLCCPFLFLPGVD